MGEQVQRVQTNVSEPQMALAMIGAWKSLFENEPTKEQIAILMAQNDLETGHRKSMWNYNIGNIKAFKEWTGDYFNLTGDEVLNGKTVTVKDMRFRAYPSLIEGVKDHIKLLSTSQRYASAWQHILHPDPTAFSKALKQGGYYTADESQYTKLMSSLYNKFNKSDSYEAARSGHVPAPAQSGAASKDVDNDWMKGYMKNHKDQNVWEQLGLTPGATPAAANTNIDPLMDQFLQQVSASEKQNKHLYKKFLPVNHMIIKVQASELVDAIEFARILCSALDEELMAKAYTYTNENEVEIECSIHGPEDSCFDTVKQLSSSLEQVFKLATAKIGGVDIKTTCIVNKKSSYQLISLKLAYIQHRKFLLKFF